jgi:Tfp pilus assembly protein PilF
MPERVATVLIVLFVSCFALGQRTAPPQQTSPREIDGLIRLDGQTAPAGVLVLLDYAANEDSAPFGKGELGRTVTDSSGKFRFAQLDQIGTSGRRQLFAVTAHFAGYRDAFQVVELSSMPRGHVDLDLRRDTSKEQPAVPPGGPGAMVSARRPVSSEAEAALLKGQELLQEKHDPKGSIANIKKALKLDPNYAPAYLLLGEAYVETREFVEAESAFEKASKLEPGDATAFFGIGFALNAQKDFIGAQRPLQRSLELNPNSAEAHYEMGKSLWGLGKWQEAEPHVRQAITINKEFPPSHVLMGNIYLRHGDGQAALTEFNEYLRLDPQGPFAQPVREMIEKIQKASGQH